MAVLAIALQAATGVASAKTSAAGPTVKQWVTPGGPYIARQDFSKLDLVHGKLITNIVLPDGYSQRKCWPVMYLLHGTANDPAPVNYSVSYQWLQIDNGALLKLRIPAILVVPGGGDSWWINNWWSGARRPMWESWLLQYLVPLVAKRLHVCPSRSEHAIAGLSMGGYGAIYLASQRPDYFGSVGSFSGVLSPESPNFLSIFPTWRTYWGRPDGFYAIGHDPLALVQNLRHTRVFVAAGNGVPVDGETSAPVSELEEIEFDQESQSFVARARRAHVAVTFDQHAGTHDPINWIMSLQHMLAWNPFKPVVAQPKSWNFYTVATWGTVWNYQYAFQYRKPERVEEFSLNGGVFAARGSGETEITLPNGKHVYGRLPFDIRNGQVQELKRAPEPNVTGGYVKLVRIRPTAVAPATATSPVSVTFKTAQRFPRDQEYQILVSTIPLNGGSSCQDLARARVFQPAAHRTVTIEVAPPASATVPGTWCQGLGYVAVTEVPRSSQSVLGNILGYAGVSLP